MTNLKTRTATISLVAIMTILAVVVLFAMQANHSTNANAHEYLAVELCEHELSDATAVANETVKSIEAELYEKGTSLIAELHNIYNFYLKELSSATNEETATIIMKLEAIEEGIIIFEQRNLEYFQSSESGIQVIEPMFLPPTRWCWCIFIPAFQCEVCSIHSAVVAIGTGFFVRGWLLASDLLWFNLNNTIYDVHHWPIRGHRVANSEFIRDTVAFRPYLTQGTRDEDIGRWNGIFASTYCGDTYNALGGFWYSKTYAGNGNVNISIIDRYDWSRMQGLSPGAMFNNILYVAQSRGIVTPFYTRINITLPGFAPFNWQYTSSGVEIIGAPSGIANVVIPDSIHDLRIYPRDHIPQPRVNITAIGASAFANNPSLTSVTIPPTVRYIYGWAFASTNLESVNFTGISNLQNICYGAFAWTNLTSITLPPSLRTMGNYIFLRSSLTSVTFAPDSQLQNISGWAFYGTALVNVIIPHSVTEIYAGAFGGIPSLRTVTLLRPFAGNTVGTALNGDAFAGSRSNLTIYVPCWDSVDVYRVAPGWQDLFTLWVWVRITTNAPLPPPPPPPPSPMWEFYDAICCCHIKWYSCCWRFWFSSHQEQIRISIYFWGERQDIIVPWDFSGTLEFPNYDWSLAFNLSLIFCGWHFDLTIQSICCCNWYGLEISVYVAG